MVWDGKLEFAFADYSLSDPHYGRDFILVDSIGLDEMRLTYEGLPLSKELLRQFYHNTEWVKALEIAKKESTTDFRKICEEHYRITPEALPTFWIQGIRSIYEITAEMILNQNHEQVAKLKLDLMQAFQKMGVTKT
jgi:phosphoribosylaminoimidazole-succinocarboxamide synthase